MVGQESSSRGLTPEDLEMIKKGPDCFGMVIRYLQGRGYQARLSNLDDSREGDVLLFTSAIHGVAFAIHAGKERGYAFVKGRIALLRFKDFLRDGQFLAGVHLE